MKEKSNDLLYQVLQLTEGDWEGDVQYLVKASYTKRSACCPDRNISFAVLNYEGLQNVYHVFCISVFCAAGQCTVNLHMSLPSAVTDLLICLKSSDMTPQHVRFHNIVISIASMAHTEATDGGPDSDWRYSQKGCFYSFLYGCELTMSPEDRS